MSYSKKRSNPYAGSNHGRQGGSGHEPGAKKPPQSNRGPSNIHSHLSVIRSHDQLQNRLYPEIHTLVLEKFDIRRDEDLVLDSNWRICSLTLNDISFPSLESLPRALLDFISNCHTLREVKIDYVKLSSSQWSSLVDNLLLNVSIEKVALLDASVDPQAVIKLLQHRSMSNLSLGDFNMDQEQLETLFSSKKLCAVEFQYLRLPPDFAQLLETFIISKPSSISEVVIQREKDTDTEPQWKKLEWPILKGALSASVAQNTSSILADASQLAFVKDLLTIAGKDTVEPNIITYNASALPPHVMAVVPCPKKLSTNGTSFPSSTLTEDISTGHTTENMNSSNSPRDSFQFSSEKSQLIIVKRPLPLGGASMKDYLGLTLMPLLIRCMHFLAYGGHLLVVDTLKGIFDSTNEEVKKADAQINDEMVKRMNALFEARRAGVWLTSRREKERINIIRDGDVIPYGFSENSSLSSHTRLWCWKKVTTDLQVEYGRYLLSRDLYRAFDVSRLKFNQQRDLQAILEQWFMLRANGEDGDQYPVQELTSKKVCGLEQAEDWVSYITRKALEVPLTPLTLDSRRVDLPASGAHPAVSQLFYGQFEENVQAARADALMAAAVRRGSTNALDDLLRMMMRYGTVFGNFRQFCTNENLFQECVDVGVHCEGFASPFNAQILLSKPPVPIEQWQPTFCSCYEDTDGIFGSLGSFFLQSFEDMHIFLNPPTVDAVLTQTMKYIHDQMERGKCQFHVLLPAWDDLWAYQFGSNSTLLTRLRRLDSQQYPSQNPYSGESHPSGKKFVLMSFASEGLTPAFSKSS